MKTTYDVIIIGAGFAGGSAAFYLAQNEKIHSILLLDAGNDYTNRKCNYENTGTCTRCKPCNLLAGFGGCFRSGDEAKISRYPSGKRLLNFVEDEADLARINETLNQDLFRGIEFRQSASSFNGIGLKSYPVSILNSGKGREVITNFSRAVHAAPNVTVRYNSVITRITHDEIPDAYTVLLSDAAAFRSTILIVATGRYGKAWWKSEVDRLRLAYRDASASIGVRFEMPRELLRTPGIHHPDFKAKKEYDTGKIKTFCFCGGEAGGVLKTPVYEGYALLDGHIRTDTANRFGNFALLHSIAPDDLARVKTAYLREFQGQPRIQRYASFRDKTGEPPELVLVSSLPTIKTGNLAAILTGTVHHHLCAYFEDLFAVFNRECGAAYTTADVNVIGLEVENDWYEMRLDKTFQSSMKGLYVIGDASGAVQGILHAAITGYVAARGIGAKV